jgi:hypothetical protein
LRRFGPGSWVGLYNQKNFVGSFGLPVKDRRKGDLMLLTAAHVIGGLFPVPTEETAVVGYGDLQPDQPHETLTAPVSAIAPDLGRLARSIPPSRVQRCSIDAAIARVSSDRELRNHINEKPIAGVRDIRETLDTDIPVRMYGANSKEREGILNTAPVAERLRLGKTQHRIFYERACHVRSIDGAPFAILGDSGSILVDHDCYALAMVVGMITEDDEPTPCALVTPLVPVLEALDVELYAGCKEVKTDRAVPFEELEL